ncbi:hypothetical protein AMECASPLE_038728 [Ameca splendens]|uniref:Uncharacterized protein n=1 Tax=Ameca splendens TaxID=208324 RepID=A0ABV0Z648_9TELE
MVCPEHEGPQKKRYQQVQYDAVGQTHHCRMTRPLLSSQHLDQLSAEAMVQSPTNRWFRKGRWVQLGPGWSRWVQSLETASAKAPLFFSLDLDWMIPEFYWDYTGPSQNISIL